MDNTCHFISGFFVYLNSFLFMVKLNFLMINTLIDPIIMTTEDEARCWFLVAQLEEMIADVEKGYTEIIDHAEIRAQIDACFVH
jgi:hypothetical protein